MKKETLTVSGKKLDIGPTWRQVTADLDQMATERIETGAGAELDRITQVTTRIETGAEVIAEVIEPMRRMAEWFRQLQQRRIEEKKRTRRERSRSDFKDRRNEARRVLCDRRNRSHSRDRRHR